MAYLSAPPPPQFPVAGDVYSPLYHNQFNNILRLYLNRIDNNINLLARDPDTISVTSGTALTAEYEHVSIDPAGGSASLSLPPAVNSKEYHITMVGAGTLTITPSGTDTILGEPDAVVSVQWTSLHLKADNNGNWIVL